MTAGAGQNEGRSLVGLAPCGCIRWASSLGDAGRITVPAKLRIDIVPTAIVRTASWGCAECKLPRQRRLLEGDGGG